ncbi:hypothetical protein B6U79_02260 [Candidatus Bathyarchaeota archaeon ex4484_231]|nr:MAG: hypothetical protein B6U79_02260 [Candidatus Bathyarchaeota archaeon ex4484_231]
MVYTYSLIYQTKELAGKVLSDIVSPGDSVAVKIHFGERYSQYYIRPIYVRKVVDKIKELGGKPFVCDTLFSGAVVLRDEAGEPLWSRRTFKDGLETAAMNGFTQETMGCPVMFADDPNGTASVQKPFEGRYIKQVYIAPAIAEADVLLSFAHFKCHDCMAIGGALKNVGVGCSSKQGKWWIHHGSKLTVDPSKCTGCGECVSVCPVGAIEMVKEKAHIIPEKCIDHFGGKVAFVNLAMDIVPLCDCDPFQGVPVVPDLGVLASKDPVAVDRACVDLVNASHGIPGSMAEAAGVLQPGVEKINAIAKMRWKATPGATHVTPDWRVMLKAAERVGLGTQRYKLVKVNFGFPPQKN